MGPIIYPNPIAFAPFSHLAGILFLLVGFANGYFVRLFTRFDFKRYLQLLADEKVMLFNDAARIAI